jgi:hypothetical protein
MHKEEAFDIKKAHNLY